MLLHVFAHINSGECAFITKEKIRPNTHDQRGYAVTFGKDRKPLPYTTLWEAKTQYEIWDVSAEHKGKLFLLTIDDAKWKVARVSLKDRKVETVYDLGRKAGDIMGLGQTIYACETVKHDEKTNRNILWRHELK